MEGEVFFGEGERGFLGGQQRGEGFFWGRGVFLCFSGERGRGGGVFLLVFFSIVFFFFSDGFLGLGLGFLVRREREVFFCCFFFWVLVFVCGFEIFFVGFVFFGGVEVLGVLGVVVGVCCVFLFLFCCWVFVVIFVGFFFFLSFFLREGEVFFGRWSFFFWEGDGGVCFFFSFFCVCVCVCVFFSKNWGGGRGKGCFLCFFGREW